MNCRRRGQYAVCSWCSCSGNSDPHGGLLLHSTEQTGGAAGVHVASTCLDSGSGGRCWSDVGADDRGISPSHSRVANDDDLGGVFIYDDA